MKCIKCNTEIEKGAKVCPNCGAKVALNAKRVVATVLVLAVIISSVAFAGWKVGWFSSLNTDSDISNEGFILLGNSFTDRQITDKKSALAAIGDVADLLGIEDVNTEFTDCKVDTLSGNTYYRFYQEYDGIPVYGRSIVIAVDENGASLSLSGNYLDVSGIGTSPAIDESAAIDYAKQYYEEGTQISNKGLVIYSLNEISKELAWQIEADNIDIQETCFISAKTGEVLKTISKRYFENVEDNARDIHVYDAQNSTLKYECVIVDSNGKVYSSTEKGWVDERGNAVKMVGENFNWNIYDGNETIIGTDGEYALKLTTLSILTELKPADSTSGKAMDALLKATVAYDFYEKELMRYSFDGTYGAIDIVINDFMNTGGGNLYLIGDTENAYSGGWKEVPITVLSFGIDNSLSIDTVGHEYTHSVERSISNMEYQGESGALMEAYSDIFGEIIEDWSNGGVLDGSCDWVHNPSGSFPRNIITPEANSKMDGTSYPTNYKGKNWVSTEDISQANDYGGVHTNNTVISHAAYLMYNGISGNNPNFKALTTEDIAQLFYRTLYTLPSDCTFSQFRALVQNTAETMYQQGYPGFSYDKVRCVSNAFFQVGIDSATTPVSKEDLVLDVYDATGQLYNNYTLYVRHSSGAEKKYTEKDVQEGIGFPAAGRYELYIEDNANTLNHTSIYVNVIAQGGVTRFPVYTECGLSAIDTPISTAPSSEPVQGDSIVPAFLSFHPFEDNKSQFLLSTYEITGGLRETDEKYGTYTNMPDFPFVASVTDDFTHDGQMSSLSISMEDAKGGLDKHLAIHVTSASGGSHNYLLTSLGRDWDGESVYYYLFKGVDSDYLVEEHLTPFSSSYDKTNFYFGEKDGNRTEFISIISLADFSKMRYEFETNMGSGGYIITEEIDPAEGSSSYSTLFSQDGKHYHYGNETVYDSHEKAMDYINKKLSAIGLTNRVGGASSSPESDMVPLFVLHREGIHDTVDLSAANTLELTDTMYFGVNPNLSSGAAVEPAPESSQTSSIFGVWDSLDGAQRMIFTSAGTFAVSYENGIQNADGTATIIDLQRGKQNSGGFAINSSSIILTIDMQQESFEYSLSGNSLSIGGLSFYRVDNALANQLVGTWENSDGKFTFDGEGNVTVAHGSSYDRGVYAILNESEMMLNIDDDGASTYDYSVDGKVFILGNQQYIKDGDSSDYNEVTAVTNTLVGTWKSDTMNDYYVFKSNGIYEYYSLESLYRIGQVTTEGLYDIISTSTIKVYQDMSGDFYSEFSLVDGILISSSYSPSSGGYIQYKKIK